MTPDPIRIHDSIEAQEALAEVARRRQQTLDEGARDWSWRQVLLLCATFLGIGVANDLERAWLLGVVLALFALAARTTVRLRPGSVAGPGAPFLVALGAGMLAALVLTQAVWRGIDLPLPNTAGMAAVCLVVLTSVPAAHRAIERRRTAAAR